MNIKNLQDILSHHGSALQLLSLGIKMKVVQNVIIMSDMLYGQLRNRILGYCMLYVQLKNRILVYYGEFKKNLGSVGCRVILLVEFPESA